MRLFDQIEDGAIRAIDAIDIALVDDPHPWEVRRGVAIAANWRVEQAANPRLFNGRMTMISALALDGATLTGTAHAIDFSTFLYWRKAADKAGAAHVFAYALPVAADGRLIAVKMAAHTANPGLTYFAAGSFEPGDFPGGRMEFAANAHREVREETGIDLGGVRTEQGFLLARAGDALVVARRYWLDEEAATIAARIRAHVAADPDPEIDGPVVIEPGTIPEPTTRHMRLVLRHFAGG
ncbi:MAG: NUDIX hydrolase [Phyllobacteriaceae bacterium]|nr:NUDIX hydrolase [Phyllobacteriaceae bacterium]